MQLPIYPINEKGILSNGTKFNNTDHGIIVENGNRATYLPGVFAGMNFHEIKNSLIEKASGDINKKYRFQAYQCQIFERSLLDFFIMPVTNFLNQHYTEFVPYTIKNDVVYIDKEETVRNIGTIGDLLKIKSLGYEMKFSNLMKENLEEYLQQKLSLQETSFMIVALYLLKDHRYQKLCQHVLANLDQIKDKNFEWGEVISALTFVNYQDQKINQEIDRMYQDEKEQKTINIFRLNWFINALKNSNYQPDGFSELLKEKVMNFYHQINEKYETNYYAVLFESLTGLYFMNQNKNLGNAMIKTLKILVGRRFKYGFYQFLNKETRLDITGHVFNGLYTLTQNKKIQNGGMLQNMISPQYERYLEIKTLYLRANNK